MRQGKPIYYWDANIFLAWLKNEVSNRKPGEMEGLAEVVAIIDRQEATMMTSVMTRTEVLESSLPSHTQNIFGKIFDRPNVISVDVTAPISNMAHSIRDYYRQNGRSLKTPDSIHLATAINHKVDEFHTFDENDLIPLSGNVAGHRLIICKPKGIQGVLF
jgi:predicted nucleic acid-binding protein